MSEKYTPNALIILLVFFCCLPVPADARSFEFPAGEFPVATAQLIISDKFGDIDSKTMAQYLVGARSDKHGTKYLSELLENPEQSAVTRVNVPDEKYFGPHAGETLPLVMFVSYPTHGDNERADYVFPYTDIDTQTLPRMQRGLEKPIFSDSDKKYPLIVLSHGLSAHAAYSFGNAINLSSHGYIVVALFYGDDRLKTDGNDNRHRQYLRPLMTTQAIDYLLSHEEFGPRIEATKIGASGHSFGGFTILALAGGDIFGEGRSMQDARIKAGLVSAPWVGSRFFTRKVYAFGDNNKSLNSVSIPILGLFGTKDRVTKKSYVLPALAKTRGPRHVVELVNQPHVYAPGSWQDQGHWELLFFDAYLKGNPESLKLISRVSEAKGGNKDRQLFEYQRN